ncbi:serine/threonine protein phosphatase [Bacillus thuringiensis]|uniref:Serine/threonine protein phosphatase n=1 Tax=Bacillus wiedmannii TaxID=1890302 RepID=A0A242YYM5_9BACI|nr:MULTISPECIES: metallophosphoesterase [Bacillus cereus group]MBG9749576.1 serine/threonine protein phosphatase [Bacillus thuringiensis]MBG9782019.1 serine/threonine protein phosphatase [Bacillus thuringiensis]OTX84834.1 serine/threonine protein phosphatase [Bacillus wiedmannii]OTZ80636.1 serine/threonine protein phosphatase [Bacillus thuringiensis serovar ostriniae]
MKIIVFSNTTGGIKELVEQNELLAVKPDLILLLGDIHKRALYSIEHFFKDIPIYGVLGENDSKDAFYDTNIKSLHRNVVNVKGYTIAGFSGVPIYTDNNKVANQFTEQELSTFLDKIGPVDIFVAHANPRWAKPEDELDLYRGFEEYSNYLLRDRPKLFLHGHTGSPLVYNIHDDTTIITVNEYQVLTID